MIEKMRSVVAFALVLWCAGAGCLMVSYAHPGVTNNANVPVAKSQKPSTNTSPMGNHSCCKARRSSSKRTASVTQTGADSSARSEQIGLPEAPTPSGVMSCCPLRSGSFVIASRGNADNVNSSALAHQTSLFLAPTDSQPWRVFPVRLPNQKQTYLRGCVFLI